MRSLLNGRNWQNFFLGFLIVAGATHRVNAAAPSVRVERSGDAVQIHFNGTLEISLHVEGPYRRVADAVSPWVTTVGAEPRFWRASLPGVSTIAAGFSHTVALRSDGSLWTWGANSFGQLGDGTTASTKVPQQVGNENSWLGVAAGDFFTIALRSDGALWAWGENYLGQLGQGTFGQGTFGMYNGTPQQIGTNTNWQAVSAGRDHVVALREDGSLWTWGGNPWGQLGNGSNASASRPQPVQPEHRWKSAAAGSTHTAAVRADGTLWTWGDNREGQMGNGTLTRDDFIHHGTTTPQQAGTETNWEAVSARGNRTLASRNDGTLWSWGENYAGQGGTGTNGRTNLRPQPVSSELTWQAFAAGNRHTVALSGGRLWAWGANSLGQLGNGTNASSNVPLQISNEAAWAAIATGYEHTVALQRDGTLWAWGQNSAGQLGDGTSTNRVSRVQVLGGAVWGSASY